MNDQYLIWEALQLDGNKRQFLGVVRHDYPFTEAPITPQVRVKIQEEIIKAMN